jgi:ketosteroid isomerase-like protein
MRTIPKTVFLTAALLTTAGCSGKPVANSAAATEAAAERTANASPVSVVEHHVASMKSGDLAAIMSDYAEDTVVITPEGLVSSQTPASGAGVYSGVDAAKLVFATLTKPGNMEAVRGMETRIEPKGDNIVFLNWTQSKGTKNEVSGQDIFIIRNNKIEFQDIIVK